MAAGITAEEDASLDALLVEMNPEGKEHVTEEELQQILETNEDDDNMVLQEFLQEDKEEEAEEEDEEAEEEDEEAAEEKEEDAEEQTSTAAPSTAKAPCFVTTFLTATLSFE